MVFSALTKEKTMSSIILLFITHTTRVLSRISEAMRQQQAEWFTNRSGHSSFRAEVVQSEGVLPPSFHAERATVRVTGSISNWPAPVSLPPHVRLYGRDGRWRSRWPGCVTVSTESVLTD
jgi:hypothetical protein